MKYVVMIVVGLSLLLVIRWRVEASTCDVVVGPGENITSINDGIAQAARVNGGSGQTVCVREGSYIESAFINGINASEQASFVLTGHPDNTALPKLRDNNPYSKQNMWKPVVRVTNSSYVIVQNLEVERSSGGGFQVDNSHHVTLKEVTAHDIFMRAIRIQESNNSSVDGCLVYNAGIADDPTCRGNAGCNNFYDNFPETVNISNSYDVTVRNCTLHDVYGNNLSSVRSYNTVFENNTVYDTGYGHSLLHLDQARKVTMQNNLVYNSNQATERSKSGGLYKLDEYYEGQNMTVPGVGLLDYRYSQGKDIVIRNNVIVNSKTGVNIGQCEAKPDQDIIGPCKLEGLIIEHNTVLDVSEGALRIRDHEQTSGNRVANNLFHGAILTQINQPTGIVYAGNAWGGTVDAAYRSSLDYVANDDQGVKDMFVDPSKILNENVMQRGQVQAEWFRVKPEYAAYGADVSTVGANVENNEASPTPTVTEPTVAPSDLSWVSVLKWMMHWGEGLRGGLVR